MDNRYKKGHSDDKWIVRDVYYDSGKKGLGADNHSDWPRLSTPAGHDD